MQTILLYERLLNSAFLLMYVRQLQTTLRRHIRIETWTDREIAIGVMLNSIPLIPGRLARQQSSNFWSSHNNIAVGWMPVLPWGTRNTTKLGTCTQGYRIAQTTPTGGMPTISMARSTSMQCGKQIITCRCTPWAGALVRPPFRSRRRAGSWEGITN